MLDVAIKRWVDCGHEDMHTVGNNTGIQLDGLVLAGPKCAKKTFPTSPPPAWTVHTGQVGSAHSRCKLRPPSGFIRRFPSLQLSSLCAPRAHFSLRSLLLAVNWNPTRLCAVVAHRPQGSTRFARGDAFLHTTVVTRVTIASPSGRTSLAIVC